MSKALIPTSTRLFTPTRTLGLVTSGLPISLFPTVPGNGHILVSLGTSYYAMDVKRMVAVFYSSQLPSEITAIYTAYDNTYFALDISYDIWIQHSNQTLGILHGHQKPVIGIFSLGDYLISWSCTEVFIWSIEQCELYGQLSLNPNAYIQTIIHPETYINKVVIGFRDGGDVELWNIKTLKRIHSFVSVEPNITYSITSMSLSNSPDIIALGDSLGRIRLLDLQQDVVLTEFHVSTSQGAITSLTYLSDSVGIGRGLFASGCSNGDLIIWDSMESKLLHVIDDAHTGRVVSLHCLPNEPLIVSAGNDNSIVVWILDGVNGQPRELRSRRGLQAPPAYLEFYDDGGRDLLAYGTTVHRTCDVARLSTASLNQAQRFPQKKSLKMITQRWRRRLNELPPVQSMAFAYCRHYDWGNIVTSHLHQPSLFVWSGHDACLLAKTIDYPITDNNKSKQTKRRRHPPSATAVAVSACGNYIAAGYSNGEIHMFNLQSGLHRGQLLQQSKLENSSSSSVTTAHCGSIVKLEFQQPNILLSGSNNESVIRCWDIYTRTLLSEFDLMSCPNLEGTIYQSICSFTTFGLLTAVVLSSTSMNIVSPTKKQLNSVNDDDDDDDDKQKKGFEDTSLSQKVVLIDMQTQSLVREFPAVVDDIISKVQFSNDGRWVMFSTVLKNYLYVYDIIATALIDWIECPSSLLSFTIDPSDTFLYLSLNHLKGGVLVLSNTHVFDLNSFAPLLQRPLSSPISIGRNYNNHLTNKSTTPDEDAENTENCQTNIAAELCCKALLKQPKTLKLSGESFGRLQAIIYLDLIKARNRPKSLAKASPDIPFFLPSSLDKLMDDNGETPLSSALTEDTTTTGSSSPLTSMTTQKQKDTMKNPFQSHLQLLLEEYRKKQGKSLTSTLKFEMTHNILQYLQSLSPSGIHIALSEIGPMGGGTNREIIEMIHVFQCAVYHRTNADFVQALLTLFLDLHHESIETLIHEEDHKKTTKQKRCRSNDDERIINNESNDDDDDDDGERIINSDSNDDDDDDDDDNSTTEISEDDCNPIQHQSLRKSLLKLKDFIEEDWKPLDLQMHQAESILKFLTHSQIE